MPARELDEGAALELLTICADMSDVELMAFVSALDPDDITLIESVLADQASVGWRADPASMANHFDRYYKKWRYIMLLSRKFTQLVDGSDPLQIWNLAGRYGKSLLLRWGTVWTFDKYPDANMIFTSYADDLAEENAIFVRDQLAAHGDQLRTQLRRDRRKVDRFVTTGGGGLLAAGIHAGITGFGAGNHGGVILDDPYKGWVEAHSGVVRADVMDRFRSVLQLRRDDPTAWMLIVHARMHEDDISGELAKAAEDGTGEHWTVTSLPSLADVDDPLGRDLGEPLEPEKFDKEQVLQRIRLAGPYLAAGLELQKPTPDEGRELKRAWFKLGTRPDALDEWTTSWDVKAKDKEAGDYVAGLVMGRVGVDHWVIDGVRGQWSQAWTEVAMALLKVRYPHINSHAVENTGYGPEVIEQLSKRRPGFVLDDETAGALGVLDHERPMVEAVMRRGLAGVKAVTPKGDKSARARAYAGVAFAGNMHVNERWHGHEAFIAEVITFPTGTYDDQVDAWSQGMKELDLLFGPVNIHSPEELGATAIRPALRAPQSRIRPAGRR